MKRGKSVLRVTFEPFTDTRYPKARYLVRISANGQPWQVWYDFYLPTPSIVKSILNAR